MTTANKITVFRMLMVPVFVILLYLDLPSAGYWALGVFIITTVWSGTEYFIRNRDVLKESESGSVLS